MHSNTAYFTPFGLVGLEAPIGSAQGNVVRINPKELKALLKDELLRRAKLKEEFEDTIEKFGSGELGARRTKLEIDAHYTLQQALRWWLYAHLPASFVLLVFILLHLYTVLFY